MRRRPAGGLRSSALTTTLQPGSFGGGGRGGFTFPRTDVGLGDPGPGGPPRPVTPPRGRVLPTFREPRPTFGVSVPAGATRMDHIDDFGFRVGALPRIVSWYLKFVEGVPNTALLDDVSALGAIPMITWEPSGPDASVVAQPDYALSTILNGDHDDLIGATAEALADWGGEVWLRFAHEMNGSWYPWGVGVNGNQPGEYVAAWQRLVRLFDDAGAYNVCHLWSPNIIWTGSAPLAPLYPGDAWVGGVAIDGYNWGTVFGSSWRSPATLFNPTVAAVRAITARPLMIGETASSEHGGDKAAWIAQFFAWLADAGIDAYVWFDHETDADWPIDTSPSAQSAFHTGATKGRSDGLRLSETFTGANGSPWGPSWDATDGPAGASATLVGGWGRLTTSSNGGWSDRAAKTLVPLPEAPYEVAVRVRPGSAGEQFARVWFDAPTPGWSGYFLEITSWEISLRRVVEGAVAVLDSAPFTFAAGDIVQVRIERFGGSMAALAWVRGGALPLDWMLRAVDPTFVSGNIGLEVNGGAEAVAVHADFDNLALHRLGGDEIY